MIHILVRLTVKDFDALEKFEQKAAAIMKDYQGKMISAFEIERALDASGEEVHILEFPNENLFTKYRQDERLQQLNALRQQAIEHTEVAVSIRSKSY